MSKKILIITGSPRKGNSYSMVESFSRAAQASGVKVTRYDAAQKKNDNEDFKKLDEDMLAADGIVLATPVYWYTFPAKIKAVIDHFYPFFLKGHTFKGKKCALIACCEEESMETFTGLEFSFDRTIALMEGSIVGKVLIPGVSEAEDIKKTDGEMKAAELTKQF